MPTARLVVGPILGIEGDDLYTVVILIDKSLNTEDLVVELEDTGSSHKWRASISGAPENTANYQLVRFVFQTPAKDHSREISYAVFNGSQPMVNRVGESEWSFVVPGISQVPKIGFGSCNGDSKKLPDELSDSAFVMWRRLLAMHQFESDGGEPMAFAFNALLLGGDQVYSDPLWNSVPYLANRWLIRFRRSRFVRNHKIPAEDRGRFHTELSEFFENLYVTTFGQPDVAAVLARIPTCMIWDDHDIVDGWGSYSEEIQNSEIFKEIYKVAKRYFELFQLRTKANRSRQSKCDFSQHLRFRNFEIFLLDNRTHRTPTQIMTEEQYESLNQAKEHLFKELTGPLTKERVLLFVVPVPAAHLNYKKQTESLVAKIFHWTKVEGSFTKSIEDDLLDHWNHKQHEQEHLRFINLIFDMAEQSDAKYLHIVSGDVHSAGGGRIKRTQGPARFANQLVASPIVYQPAGRLAQWILSKAANLETHIKGYQVGVYPFGFDDNKLMNIYQRNFGFLFKPQGKGLMFYLMLEGKGQGDTKDPTRRVVTQPRLFRPVRAGVSWPKEEDVPSL